MQQSELSEIDVFKKAHEIYSGGKNEIFLINVKITCCPWLTTSWLSSRKKIVAQVVDIRDPARMMQVTPILSDLVLIQWEEIEQKKVKKGCNFGNDQRRLEWIQKIQKTRIGTIEHHREETRESKLIDEKRHKLQRWSCSWI